MSSPFICFATTTSGMSDGGVVLVNKADNRILFLEPGFDVDLIQAMSFVRLSNETVDPDLIILSRVYPVVAVTDLMITLYQRALSHLFRDQASARVLTLMGARVSAFDRYDRMLQEAIEAQSDIVDDVDVFASLFDYPHPFTQRRNKHVQRS